MKAKKIIPMVLAASLMMTACGDTQKAAETTETAAKAASAETEVIRETEDTQDASKEASEEKEEAEDTAEEGEAEEAAAEKNAYGLTEEQMSALKECLNKAIKEEYEDKLSVELDRSSLAYKPNLEVTEIESIRDFFEEGDVFGNAIYVLGMYPESYFGMPVATYMSAGLYDEYFPSYLMNDYFVEGGINALPEHMNEGQDVMEASFYVLDLNEEYPENNLANALYVGLGEFYNTLNEEERRGFWDGLFLNLINSQSKVSQVAVKDQYYNVYISENTYFCNLIIDALS